MQSMTLFGMLALAAAFLTSPAPAAGPAQVEFVSAQDEIKVLIGGQHVTSYIHRDALPKPSLYPLKTHGGIVLSRGYPLAKVEGETADHPHHVGLFFTYDEVNGSDFWGATKIPPQIKHIRTAAAQSGENGGQLKTLSHWIAKDGKTVLLEENRTMLFRPVRDGYGIDISIDLVAKTKVEFGDTKEGMFALRTADWLREKGGTGRYFSSEGTQGSKDIWGRRARWVALEGQKDGRTAGVAILHHPRSVNHPTFWHARDYGLFSANPLGQEAFEKGTRVEKPTPLHLTLEPGNAGRFRFLVLVYEGARTAAQIEEEYQKFAR